jgi:hypothetical protein
MAVVVRLDGPAPACGGGAVVPFFSSLFLEESDYGFGFHRSFRPARKGVWWWWESTAAAAMPFFSCFERRRRWVFFPPVANPTTAPLIFQVVVT